MKKKKIEKIGEFITLSEKSLIRILEIEHKIFRQWRKKMSIEVNKMRKILNTKKTKEK